VNWSVRGLDKAVETVRATPLALSELLNRGKQAGDLAAKTLSTSRDVALETAENVIRDGGADQAADVVHSVRTAAGVLDPSELPIDGFDELNVSQAVAAVKDLTDLSDVRAILAYEESHKQRQGIVSAAQARVAHIAQEVVGIR
jgi:hypothetical protein